MLQDVLGEPSIRYGKLLAGLTGHRKPRKMARIQAFCAWRDPGSNGENVEPGGSALRFALRTGMWLTAWMGSGEQSKPPATMKCATRLTDAPPPACSRRAGGVSPRVRL